MTSDEKYKIALTRWVSKKFHVKRTYIEDIRLDVQTVDACDTCGPETDIVVTIYYKRSTPMKGGNTTHKLEAYELGTIIREILEVAPQ